jgi:hypothetical protein
MNTVRLNVTLPEDVGEILSGVKNKSSYIADAVRDKKRLEEKKKLRRELASAYKHAAEEEYATYREWEDTLKDGLEE